MSKIDEILNELINVACNYEKGKDVDLDAKANETNHALQALIASQKVQLLDRVEKELLTDETENIFDKEHPLYLARWNFINIDNIVKAEQRQALNKLKEEQR